MLSFFRRREEPAEGATTFVRQRYDRLLLAVVLILLGLGVVMVYSASIVSASVSQHAGAFYLKRQLFYVGVALAVMILTANLHHEFLRRSAPALLAVGFIMLLVVLAPGISASAKGAARWINFGPARFQPSEAMKIAWIVWLASWLSRHQDELHDRKVAWLYPGLLVTALAGLFMAQPDFGSTMICGGMLLLLVWTAGGRHLDIAALVLAGALFMAVAILQAPYRLKRLTAFLSPEEDRLGAAYHINQALIGFGSGDWLGLGLGGSKQKLFYLPEAHTDFIFSIIGEELGLVGVACVVLLFALLVWRGFVIARNATTAFGALLAFGLTAEIGFQAAVNMAVATAMLPTKGLTLPLVSYGGSSLVSVAAAVGVLLNISRRQPPPAWMHALFERAGQVLRGPIAPPVKGATR